MAGGPDLRPSHYITKAAATRAKYRGNPQSSDAKPPAEPHALPHSLRPARVLACASQPTPPPTAAMTDVFVTVIKVLSSLSALYMCLSPSTSMLKIHRAGTTGSMSIVPLVALWACNHMWLLYGYVTSDVFPLMVTYIVGDVTSIAFITVFYWHMTKKRSGLKAIAFTLSIIAIVTVYAVLAKEGVTKQPQSQVKLIIGIISIASSILLYASPLATIKLVIQTKSSESIPFGMVIAGSINNSLWIIYGYLVHDAMLAIPCVVNVITGAVQIVLYFVYHPKRQKPGASVPVATAGAIEIVTDAPQLEEPSSITPPQATIEVSVVSDNGDMTKTAIPQSEEITMSGIVIVDIEPESAYAELRSPGGQVAKRLDPVQE